MENKINCLIVDDEPLAIKLIEKHCGQIPNLEVVATAQNALKAFELLESQSIDLIFLDIQMPVLTGIEFVKSLGTPPSIIFTTAYREYAVESYELEVVDYLLKPITFPRFFKAINKFINQTRPKMNRSAPAPQTPAPEEAYIYVNVNKKYVKVSFSEILYVESIKDYVRIHTQVQSILTKDTLVEFEQKLPHHFIRVHRSYIINPKQVTAFTAHDIEIGNKEIPIGVSYKKQVLEQLRMGS